MSGTLASTISSTGISAPTYAAILSSLTATAEQIFGSDVYLAPDSQDGQLLAIIAAAVSDTNAATIAAYNAYSPSTAQGNGLSSVVKINGLTRNVASYSTVPQNVVGTVGLTIVNGYVTDANNVVWNLPPTVVIPAAGSIVVTATCSQPGAVTAAVGSITTIGNPQLGWLSTSNTSTASPGAPVETDGLLRNRQSISVAIPSQTVLEGLTGALLSLPNVTRGAAYENDTDVTDANGNPPHSIALVIEGGNAEAIAQTIFEDKAPGCTTVGNISETVTDIYGIPRTIRFYTPTEVPITVVVNVQALAGYTSLTGAAINASIVAAIIALPIGTPIYVGRLYTAANSQGGKYDVLSIQLSRGGAPVAAANVPIAFNEAATTNTGLVTLTVTT